ncbi:MAG: hypothetical protein IPN67_16285 [Bacteroidales bacterium]|nr:hypothetical protein [Bacteroidales bacterium]
MKKMLFAALLIVAFGSASFSRELVAEGKTYSALGDYRIEIADNPVTINGDEFTAFVISYQNTPLEVRVAIRKEHDCKKYIVLSEKLWCSMFATQTILGLRGLINHSKRMVIPRLIFSWTRMNTFIRKC